MTKLAPPFEGDPRCSFCAKAEDAVRRLVAGPGVYICDQCIDRCNQVVARERVVDSRRHVRTRGPRAGYPEGIFQPRASAISLQVGHSG